MPKTPKAQRFLSHLLKPLPQVLRKRTQGGYDQSPVPTMQELPASRPACVALQNEDKEQDVIVITALNVVPFCCHADLLAMDRLQLATVAWTLNQKLPKALQIDVRPCLPDAEIRDAIELLVGIRTGDTPAPSNVIRTGPPQSPGSPLANKDKAHAVNAALAALQEAEEDVSTQPSHEGRCFEEYMFLRERLTPSPALLVKHSQSDHNVFVGSRRRKPAHVPRTQSQKLPRQPHPYVPTFRRRIRARTVLSSRPVNVVMTSTPNKLKLTHGVQGSRLSVKPGLSAKVASTTFKPGVVTRALKRKISELSADETEDQVSFGIEGLTIPVVPSRMEVDPEDVYLY